MFTYLLHLHTPSPSLISLTVSIDVKHHVYSLTADGHAWMSWAGDHDSETWNNLAPLQSSCNFHKSLAIRCHFLSKYLSMQRHVRLQLQLPNKLCTNSHITCSAVAAANVRAFACSHITCSAVAAANVCAFAWTNIYWESFATTILCFCSFQLRGQFCSNKTASQFILFLFCRFCNFKTCKSCNCKGIRLFKSWDVVNFASRFGSCESTVGKLSL